MTPLLLFAILLAAAVLVSALAGRTVLSTAVVFLVGGFVAGDGVLGWVSVRPQEPIVSRLIEHALVAVLFVEGSRLTLGTLREQWRLPGRSLLAGLPLTLGLLAVAARWLLPLSWPEALLLGSVLSPTDPVFAEAIVGRERVPAHVRHTLNAESGLNDGLALPAVIVFLTLAQHAPEDVLRVMLEVAGGVAIGVVVPWLVRSPFKPRLVDCEFPEVRT